MADLFDRKLGTIKRGSKGLFPERNANALSVVQEED
jgi:hypothetical protein